jgi:DNA-directed RNA polymerase subunit E'/Rpb7
MTTPVLEDAGLFVATTMSEVVVLKPHHLSKNYRDVIADKLAKHLGGRCVKHGYVKPDSIRVSSVGDGKLVANTLNGDVEFHVSLVADVCNPPIGSIVNAKVVNSNKFGLLAHAGYENRIILEIVVTRQSIGFKSAVDPDAVSVNDRVQIEVVGKKFELNDTKISIIGKIVKLLSGGEAVASLDDNKIATPPEDESEDPESESSDLNAGEEESDDGADDGATIEGGSDAGYTESSEASSSQDEDEDEDASSIGSGSKPASSISLESGSQDGGDRNAADEGEISASASDSDD